MVSTLGRIEPLERLLESLSAQTEAGDRLVIVAQAHVDAVELVASTFRTATFDIQVITSERGASRGRNAGVAHLPDGERLLHFPNDTTWFPDGSLAAIRLACADVRVGAITVVDENGPKFVLPEAGVPLDRWNVWNVIEMGLLIRRSSFDELGGFDSELGTGASSPWQAGEVTDLLLRLLERQPTTASTFEWLPADIAVGGIADASGLSTSERRRKLRAYGRGLGRIVMRHRYPWWWRFAFVTGGLAFGLRHRDTNSLGDGWWVFIGRAEGMLGRTIGGRSTAVTR
ncbi:glycosyltransferase family 2 protein [Agromyces sp. NPDC058136]|uniref:glycosyltransferase family 2 protein n=1 Tax=Agromyces sp. NPDC058136 TaxID=3346354 RepID=UPI0036D87EEE